MPVLDGRNRLPRPDPRGRRYGQAFRGQGGRAVSILDPRSPEFGFNVLDWIGKDPSTAEEDVATVVGWLTLEMPDQGGTSRFFSLSSQQLLTGVLGHIVFSPEYEDKRTLKALHEFMAQPEASFRKRLAHIHKASTNKFVRDALGPFINLTEDTFSGVFKGATNEIDWLKYDPYAGLVSGSSFKAQDLLTGQMDVFISVDLAHLQDHPGIGRVIIGALLNTVYKAEGAVADRVLFLVDEARMLGTMSLLETVRDALRKYGITLVLVYQSVGQLDEIWAATPLQVVRQRGLDVVCRGRPPGNGGVHCQEVRHLHGRDGLTHALVCGAVLAHALVRVTRPDHAAGGDAGHARRRPDRVRQGPAADPLRPCDFLPAQGDEGAGRREPVSAKPDALRSRKLLTGTGWPERSRALGCARCECVRPAGGGRRRQRRRSARP